MSLVSGRLKSIRPSQTKATAARAAALKAEGKDIVSLSLGEPDFDTPAHIAEAGIRAIREGRTRYTTVAGTAALREAIRGKFLRDNNLDYSVDQITVGCGAKQVVFDALFASLEPGEEVIVPTPCWVSYPDMVRLAGGEPILVECLETDGFKLTPERLQRAIAPRTKWLMLNSPNNPTGAVYGADDLGALAEILHRHPQVHVLSDDIYEKLVYGEAGFATMAGAAPDLFDRTLTINGVSKASAMTGWRVGYGAGPIELIKAMNVIQGQTTSHTSSISQHAAIEAIAGDQSHVAAFRVEFENRRDLVIDKINRAPGLSCRAPDGAFYAFVNCESVIGRRTANGGVIESDSDFVLYLLDEVGVAVVPGSGFLASPYFRISYASAIADLADGCDRIIAACTRLAEDRAA